MKISDEGFKTRTNAIGVDVLLFDSSRAQECCEFAIKNNLKHVDLDDYQGFTDTNLDSIMPLKDFIEGLTLNEKVDFGELWHFKKLKKLGALDNRKNILDLECFPDLETLACNVTERLKGLETCSNLKSLTISYYKPKSKDLSGLPTLKSLKHLNLIKVDIAALLGIDRFQNLRVFRVYSSPKLDSIAPLQVLSGSLEEIEIDHCKKIKDYEVLGKVKSLKKIILADSGEMETIAFVKALPNLQFISFWNTNVLDGDLSHCEGINYVGFDNKRHYSHKVEQFKK